MSRRGGPTLTKTQQLRQARSAAVVRDYEQKQEAASRQRDEPFKARRKYVRPEPKKVDFTRPGMTKTMLARVKQAEKFKQEYERKQEALTTDRMPRRTPAPIGGDARAGRERIPGRERRTPRVTPAATPRRTSPARREYDTGRSHYTSAARFPSPKRAPKLPQIPEPPVPPVPKKTAELAKVMKADVVVAEPVSDGLVSNIVIPPGLVNEEHTTIVNISQPAVVEPEPKAASQVANRSIQVISETLDEQDAAEAATVQSRLSELQQARRDFVITVANVGGNAVHLEDETPPPFLLDSLPGTPIQFQPSLAQRPPTPKYLIRLPDVEDEFLQPQYGRDHADVAAAREYMQKAKAEREAREAARRMEEEFERIAASEQAMDQLPPDAHFEQGVYQERDLMWEEDESPMPPTRPRTPVASVPPTPQSYQYEPFDFEAFERFVDLKNYPPCPNCTPTPSVPPPGRENLPRDLWGLDDPWYREPLPSDMSDLIQFDESDLIKFH